MSDHSQSERVDIVTPLAEVGWVLGLTLGIMVTGSLILLVQRAGQPVIEMSDGRLLRTLGVEVALAFALVLILRRRGWTVARLTVPFRWTDLLHGLGILVVTLLVHTAISLFTYALALNLLVRLAEISFAGHLSWPIVAIVAMINPLFEETLFLGYLVNALRSRGIGAAVGVSVVARALVHLYQGPLALFSITPLGLVFALYFVRTRRLWPVVMAHMLLDVWALGLLAYNAS